MPPDFPSLFQCWLVYFKLFIDHKTHRIQYIYIYIQHIIFSGLLLPNINWNRTSYCYEYNYMNVLSLSTADNSDVIVGLVGENSF